MDLRAFLRHVGVFFDPSDPVEDMVRTNAESQSIQGKDGKERYTCMTMLIPSSQYRAYLTH